MNSHHNFSRQRYNKVQNDSNNYDYQKQKQFIFKEKEWIRQIQSKYHNKRQNYDYFNHPKPIQQKNYNWKKLDNAHDIRQMELEKTVKHKNYIDNNNNDNKSQITTKIVYYDKDQQKRFGGLRTKKQSQTNILSISQIKKLQKQSIDETKIHKITSSASKNKIRTSESNESKLSQKLYKKQENPVAARYNKYINNQPLLNINIDLRKQVVQQTLVAGQILRNNLNKRRIQRCERPPQQIQISNKHQTPRNNYHESQLKNNLQLDRSRSNLSKYCQIQERSRSRITLQCSKQDKTQNQKVNSITPRKIIPRSQSQDKSKIHKICSVNYKLKQQQEGKKFFSQRKINKQYQPNQNYMQSERKLVQSQRQTFHQIQDIMNFNLQFSGSLGKKDKKSSFNIRQNYLQQTPVQFVPQNNQSKKARIKLSIFKK